MSPQLACYKNMNSSCQDRKILHLSWPSSCWDQFWANFMEWWLLYKSGTLIEQNNRDNKVCYFFCKIKLTQTCLNSQRLLGSKIPPKRDDMQHVFCCLCCQHVYTHLSGSLATVWLQDSEARLGPPFPDQALCIILSSSHIMNIDKSESKSRSKVQALNHEELNPKKEEGM